ncbi:hypothetical protein QA612_08880 [Evansella sp. AB-P1]|uniref:hypothetical protein n=1 Tax=Evansella sp. AB-P1 TaxID=3037653 RepID=UPI00241E3F88|nr:hypothetical protein [Evansella sp. AB-P1]MDG5787609.1 hypothetical protein [Evansella sp. AB-P1]
MGHKWTSLLFLICLIFLSGCLYPNERRVENQIPYADQIQSVQSAIIQYRLDHGVLPVLPRDEGTPIFRKYPIDFSRLIPDYMQHAPGNSFENGGTFQYVLIYPEEIPEVKLIDLSTVRQIQEFQRRIQIHQRENRYAPVDEIVGTGLFRLDYEALNYDEEPTVNSPFHPTHRLPLLMRANGDIVIDYSIDIIYYIDEYGMGPYEIGDDLRWLLVDHSPFVPVYSIPQTMNEDQTLDFTEETE